MSKREKIRARRRKQQMQKRILIIVMMVAGALLIAAALIAPSLTPVGDITTIEPRTFNTLVDGTTIGDPNAPVRVDVWEDFQCPACANYTESIEPSIIQNYVETGKVVYTFHHYPFIDSNSTTKESQQAANASMCASEQGRFWDYHDMLYKNWNGENQGAFSNKRLNAFAEALNLDMDAFKACFSENRYKEQIDSDFQAGVNMGVTGTPSVFVNGVQLAPGYVPSFEDASQAIEAALAGE